MNAARRAARLSVEQLCSKYDNEETHTRHVTAMALRLFDGCRRALKLAAGDRAILEAAGRLHDIAYSIHPSDHRQRSAGIVLREGLKGFSDPDRDLIVAVMLLHSGDARVVRRHHRVRRLSQPQRALRLGALLRVADGLDFGHRQDASIQMVRAVAHAVQVTVRSRRFPQNLERANQKADLWRLVFPMDIELVRASRGERMEPVLIRPGLRVAEAARRLLALQAKTIWVNIPGAREGRNAWPLHDIRVAARQMRAVLRAFRRPLVNTSASRLDRALQQMIRALGPARDADVWVAFLTSPDLKPLLAGEPGWEAIVRLHFQRQRRQLTVVRRCLSKPRAAALKLQFGRLLRIELPRLVRTEPGGPLEKFARRQLRREWRRALALASLHSSRSPDDLHRLRIALRRVRYLGVFFAPVLGATVEKLKRRVHAVERSLARVHDTDVGLARVTSGRPKPPRVLVSLLKHRRREHLARLDETWRRLNQPAFQRSVHRKLRM